MDGALLPHEDEIRRWRGRCRRTDLQNGIGNPYPPAWGLGAVNLPWAHAHWGNRLPQRHGAAAESLRI